MFSTLGIVLCGSELVITRSRHNRMVPNKLIRFELGISTLNTAPELRSTTAAHRAIPTISQASVDKFFTTRPIEKLFVYIDLLVTYLPF